MPAPEFAARYFVVLSAQKQGPLRAGREKSVEA
jgi:hypothetical protein